MQSDSRGNTLRRITKAALGGVASCALILGGTQAATGLAPNMTYTWDGPLSDLRPDVPGGPLVAASASLQIKESPDEGTGFILRVTGINVSEAKPEFGAHLHVGPCTERVVLPTDPGVSPDTTGGHYNSDGQWASRANEVWFTLATDDLGVANDETWVSFNIKDTTSPGFMSIVLHELPTDPTTPKGVAGAREACLPVVVTGWAAPI